MIEDPSVVKLVHAGAVDLKIFFQGLARGPRMCSTPKSRRLFLGYGHQIGYADLVKRITRVQLSKTMQYTDWSAAFVGRANRLRARRCALSAAGL
jgi:ribonuclease D